MTLIRVEDLRKSFGNRQVVDAVSFAMEVGETLAIVGESGSGKTTLLRMLACLLEQDAGEIYLNEASLLPFVQHLVKGHPQVKLVAQDYQLFPNLSLRENIIYALRFYKTDFQQQRVDELIQGFGLAEVQHQIPKRVSGGEQQRTSIARAIAEEPELLLLDEPFSHLDSLNKQKLKMYLKEVVEKEKITCILVTHDLLDALTFANRIGVMKQGKLVQIGSFAELLHNPIEPYVSAFVKAGVEPIEAYQKLMKGFEPKA